MKEAKRVSILFLLFIAAILFVAQGIAMAEEGVKEPAKETTKDTKESVKETVKETKESISDTAKEVASEVKKNKDVVVKEVKKDWVSVKRAVKGAYSATKEEITDTAITAKVKTTFFTSKKKDTFKNIKVSTKNRAVTLSGRVNTVRDAADAIETALKVDGVETVNSKLKIGIKTE